MLDFNLAPHIYDMCNEVLIIKTMGEKMYFYIAPSAKGLEQLGYRFIGKCDGYLLYAHENGQKRCVKE